MRPAAHLYIAHPLRHAVPLVVHKRAAVRPWRERGEYVVRLLRRDARIIGAADVQRRQGQRGLERAASLACAPLPCDAWVETGIAAT